MNVAFLGTPEVAAGFLEAVHGAGHRISLAVTNPDRPAGRSARPRPSPVKALAEDLGLPLFQPRSVRRPAFLNRLREAAPDLLVVVAFGRILPAAVLEAAPLGAVNVHFSLLPKYRGAAPVQWSLVHGERFTGVTTMRLNEGMDEGDILLQSRVEILPGEHTPSLFGRLRKAGTPLLLETIRGLEAGSLQGVPQDPSEATYAPVIRREDGEPDLSLPAGRLEGLVRGLDPWPGVWVARNGRRIRIRRALALPGEAHEEPPGSVLGLHGEGLRIACGNGTVLEITAVQPEGRREISARDAVNGRQILPGEVLEPVSALG